MVEQEKQQRSTAIFLILVDLLLRQIRKDSLVLRIINKSHADGANLLADALAPYNGIVMWRAFVYDSKVPDDRVKQAYNEFVPFDGMFRKNVIIQVKNGPLDFQPREPFSPLFGAMHKTPLMTEFQITQEYLGFSVHLVFQAPLYEECLKSDTYSKGKGSLVAKIIDGELDNQKSYGNGRSVKYRKLH